MGRTLFTAEVGWRGVGLRWPTMEPVIDKLWHAETGALQLMYPQSSSIHPPIHWSVPPTSTTHGLTD